MATQTFWRKVHTSSEKYYQWLVLTFERKRMSYNFDSSKLQLSGPSSLCLLSNIPKFYPVSIISHEYYIFQCFK